jgi:hypothetical protein
MNDPINPYHLALIRDALGQAGSEQGAGFAGGLRAGGQDVLPAAGDLELLGSIRASIAISAGLTTTVEPSIANAAWAPLPMDTVRWDTDSMANLAAASNRITIRTPGVYLITAKAMFYANATGIRLVGIYLNSSLYIAAGMILPNAGNTMILNCVSIWQCNPGDTLDCQVYQDSGAPLTVYSRTYNRPEFAAVRIA